MQNEVLEDKIPEVNIDMMYREHCVNTINSELSRMEREINTYKKLYNEECDKNARLLKEMYDNQHKYQ